MCVAGAGRASGGGVEVEGSDGAPMCLLRCLHAPAPPCSTLPGLGHKTLIHTQHKKGGLLKHKEVKSRGLQCCKCCSLDCTVFILELMRFQIDRGSERGTST